MPTGKTVANMKHHKGKVVASVLSTRMNAPVDDSRMKKDSVAPAGKVQGNEQDAERNEDDCDSLFDSEDSDHPREPEDQNE